MSSFEERRDSALGILLFAGVFAGFVCVLLLASAHWWLAAGIVFGIWVTEMAVWATYLLRDRPRDD